MTAPTQPQLTCHQEEDGGYVLEWPATGYALTVRPSGKVIVTRSPLDTATPPWAGHVAALCLTPTQP